MYKVKPFRDLRFIIKTLATLFQKQNELCVNEGSCFPTQLTVYKSAIQGAEPP